MNLGYLEGETNLRALFPLWLGVGIMINFGSLERWVTWVFFTGGKSQEVNPIQRVLPKIIELLGISSIWWGIGLASQIGRFWSLSRVTKGGTAFQERAEIFVSLN